jgi:3'(2'), 5'-bisphosphate nucleotidase
MSDHDDAARYAAAAGELLVELREQLHDQSHRPWLVGDAGDVQANRRLLELLATDHPDDPVLSEESVEDPRRYGADRVWIIDPLDGTREFTEAGRTDWAVHVALWQRDVGVHVGAVALPAQGRVISTADPPVVPPRHERPVRVVVSRTRPPVSARRVAEALDAELVPMGSAGAKAMAVVSGDVDAYVHAGGQYEWDSAAPIAVARAAGLHVSRIDGSELQYNQRNPWLPDLIVCRRELTETVLSAAAA